MLKKTRFVFWLLLLAALSTSVFAQPDGGQDLWKFGKEKLAKGNQKFSIALSKVKISDEDRVPGDGRCNSILITVDVKDLRLEYAPQGGNSPKIQIKIDDVDDLKKLKDLLVTFEEKMASVKNKEAASQSISDDEYDPKLPAYSGSLGNFNVSYDFGSKGGRKDFHADPYGGTIMLTSADGENSKFISIDEPTALLFTIDSLSEIVGRMKQAITSEADAKLATQQAEVAAVKAAGDEKEKATKYTQDKVQAYLATSSGIKLAGDIYSLHKQITALNYEEKKYLLYAEKEMRQIMNTPGSDPSYAVNQYTFLLTNHKDSDELSAMRADLRKLLDQFQSECGMSYDDAWANGGQEPILQYAKKQKIIDLAAKGAGALIVLGIGAVYVRRLIALDKKGMAPQWYQILKNFSVQYAGCFKEKDPMKRREMIKSLLKRKS